MSEKAEAPWFTRIAEIYVDRDGLVLLTYIPSHSHNGFKQRKKENPS